MKQVLHGVVVAAVVAVLGLGYWSAARADSDGSGGAGEDQKLTGIVETFDEDSVTIDGVEYGITGDTEVEGDLVIGGEVKIEFVQNEDGTFTALELESEGDDDLEEDEDEGEDDDADEDESEDEGEGEGEDEGDDADDDEGEDDADDDADDDDDEDEDEDDDDGDDADEDDDEGEGD